MNEMFTELARKAIEYARDEAARLRHDYIGTEHLFLAISEDESGKAILRRFGLTRERIRQIEHDALLTEQIIRFLILTADHLTQADIDKPTPLMIAATLPPQPEVPQEPERPRREPGVPSIFDEPFEEPESSGRSY